MSVLPRHDPCAPATTDRTANDRMLAVLRSLCRLRQNVGDEHSLRDLARSALLSPYYFHRVFRQLTDSTPARFVAAVRMAEAKRLLAYTSTSVTDVCMQVGYSSLGTFTSQFTRLVGVSPRQFRRVTRKFADQSFDALLVELRQFVPVPACPQVRGDVLGDRAHGDVAAVGMFTDAIPQGRPAACAIVPVPGPVAVGDLADGDYYALAMSFDPSVTVTSALVHDPEQCFVGANREPVRISDGSAVAGVPIVVRMRHRTPIDPPLVMALPLLLAAEAIGDTRPAGRYGVR